MSSKKETDYKLQRSQSRTLKIWRPRNYNVTSDENVSIYCGWGKLFFGQTFSKSSYLIQEVRAEEEKGKRNMIFYVQEPHVLISLDPQNFFLDPSHTYRLWLEKYQKNFDPPKGFIIRKVTSNADIEKINRIYEANHMSLFDTDFFTKKRKKKSVTLFVAEHKNTKEILGVAMGIDHYFAFKDPDNGSSLWSLAVDPHAPFPAIGSLLINHVINFFKMRGRAYLDLSVLYNNKNAITLYEKFGFERVPVFCVKPKNASNEKLFTGLLQEKNLSSTGKMLAGEAKRRGISFRVLSDKGHFELFYGGRKITCYDSLSSITSSIAYRRCADKSLTNYFLKKKGFSVPNQIIYSDIKDAEEFLKKNKTVVIKPATGDMGMGITLEVKTMDQLIKAVSKAKELSSNVLIEKYIEGMQISVNVIQYKVVSAAIFSPPKLWGTGNHTIGQLVKKYNRRNMSSSVGECKVPLDDEMKRSVSASGYDFDSILPEGECVVIRKNTNEHMGSVAEYINDGLPLHLKRIAEKASRELEIPVVGIDFIVPDMESKVYRIIEVNEKPPICIPIEAEKCIDFFFPETGSK